MVVTGNGELGKLTLFYDTSTHRGVPMSVKVLSILAKSTKSRFVIIATMVRGHS